MRVRFSGHIQHTLVSSSKSAKCPLVFHAVNSHSRVCTKKIKVLPNFDFLLEKKKKKKKKTHARKNEKKKTRSHLCKLRRTLSCDSACLASGASKRQRSGRTSESECLSVEEKRTFFIKLHWRHAFQTTPPHGSPMETQ